VLANSTTDKVALSELVGALSFALDLTEGQPPGHSLRCCWIGMHIGQRLGLASAALSDLYYMLLLKDVGCSSNAARICELFLTDDLSFKSQVKGIDGGLPEQVRFALSQAGAGQGLAEKLRAVVRLARAGGRAVMHELVDTRCHRGADVARRMQFNEDVARGILDLDEHWSGRGQPEGLKGEQISLYARIALLAQVLDVFHAQHGAQEALAEIRRRSGVWFDPALVAVLQEVATPEFWAMLTSDQLDRAVVELEPQNLVRLVDEDYLDAIAQGFAQVVDAKSPFTSGHSDRVALFADLIAEELGMEGARRRWLRRAALLHDIGKLGVPNIVLDKPGKLDDGEWVAIKRHPALGEEILSRVAVFRDLAVIAAAHHERLDGKGYPRGIAADDIGFETRIVTVADIFDALTADRPYRDRIPVSRALAMMAEWVGPQLDARCFAALVAAMGKVEAAASEGEAVAA
jgi:putative nucleotidyltransferase with HDIG domain